MNKGRCIDFKACAWNMAKEEETTGTAQYSSGNGELQALPFGLITT